MIVMMKLNIFELLGVKQHENIDTVTVIQVELCTNNKKKNATNFNSMYAARAEVLESTLRWRHRVL